MLNRHLFTKRRNLGAFLHFRSPANRALAIRSETIFSVWNGKQLEHFEPLESYVDRPFEFCTDILGVNLWEKQREIVLIEAVRDNPRVAVSACYASGKTFLAACLLIWWLYTRRPALIVTTAPTGRQVKTLLWKEVRKVLRKSRIRLPGKILQAKLEVGDDWWAMGFSSDEPNSVAGLHAPQNVLFVEDEAAGMEPAVVEGFEGITASPNSRHLKIGNPVCDKGPFWDCFNNPKISPQWFTLFISALETPNYLSQQTICPGLVPFEWVDARRKRWGENSPLWITRVLGQFYLAGAQKVVPAEWVIAAQDRWREHCLGGDTRPVFPKELLQGERMLAVDVAGGGQDETMLYTRQGRVVQFLAATQEPDLMKQATWIVELANHEQIEVLIIDATNIGKGLADRLAELSEEGTLKARVVKIAFYNKGKDPEFEGILDEIQFAMRGAFDPANPAAVMIDPTDTELAAELSVRGWSIGGEDGAIKVERKRDVRKRGVPSPDRGDSCSLLFAQIESGVWWG